MRSPRSVKVFCALLLSVVVASPVTVFGQATAPAASGAMLVRGTVKAVDGTSLTVTTDAGQSVIVLLTSAVRVQQLSPGSTDLKTAQASTLESVAVGDRVLVSARPGEGNALTASRVILMKSGDIAQRNEASQSDWRKRGAGGIVDAVDSTAGTVAISSGSHKENLVTSPTTIFRKYSGGSVKFEDAKRSSLPEIQTGDQLRVRGDKSADGSAIQAEEIVFGSFRNLSGTITSIDTTAGTITLKDSASKQDVAVVVTPASDMRALPPAMAATLASRGGTSPKGAGSGAAHASGTGGEKAASSTGSGADDRPSGAGGRSAGGDLSQMMDRLPTMALADLKPGAALMIVASGSAEAGVATPLAAVVVLSGVEPLLAAVPKGGQPITISPWNLGGGDAGSAP